MCVHTHTHTHTHNLYSDETLSYECRRFMKFIHSQTPILTFLWSCIMINLTIKPTRFTNFSNLLLEWKSTCFRQFFCPSSGVFHCIHSNGICHTVLQTACEQDQDRTSCCLKAVCKTVWHIPLLCVQWKTPDDGQKICLKHVEFHSKNKFEKLLHLVGFNI
jgi:hypothetical protein